MSVANKAIKSNHDQTSLQEQLELLNDYLAGCDEGIDLTERAKVARPDRMCFAHLSELSDVIWLVLLDMVARQMRHHSMPLSTPGKKAIQRRLVIMVDLIHRLEGYRVITRECRSYRTIKAIERSLQSKNFSSVWA